LFWDTPVKKKPGDNEAIVKSINSLPNGAAIEDGRLPRGDPPLRGPGGHHQKLVIVSGAQGLIAFLGGMDLNDSRVDVGGFNPLHDVHIRITGPAAAECLAVFRGRWLDHPAAPALDQQKFRMDRSLVEHDFAKAAANKSQPLSSVTVPAGRKYNESLLISIGKTYPKLSKFNPGETYAFAREGEQSAWQLVKNAITNARRWIYVEDQYFVSRRARSELLKKIKEPEFQFLLVLMGSSWHFENSDKLSENEFPYLISARNEFRTDLAAIDPTKKKWRLFSLKPNTDTSRRPWCGDFVHSKLWICDDDFVVVGSANCDDRGYTYDSEIMAGITEEPLQRAAGARFARDLRIALWHKHLGVPHAQLADFTKGLAQWIQPMPASMVVDVSDLQDSPLLGKKLIRDDKTIDFVWTHMIDTDADKL
jgi:phosphatidylserine/phosphatidylglycerophosphate/cardiolipin synthase-like enzyme